MKKGFVFLVLLGLSMLAFAQPVRVRSVDAVTFPEIKLLVDFGNAQPQEQDVKILEGNVSLPVSLKPLRDSENGGNALFILVENSGFTFGKTFNEMKASLSEIIPALSPGTLVNIGYYGPQVQNGKALELLSVEFTTDYQRLLADFEKIKPYRDTTFRQPYTFKSTFEALDYMETRTNLPANRMLLVLSTAVNNDRSPVSLSDCSDKSIKAAVPFYGLTYKTANRTVSDNFVILADRTSGKSAYVSSSKEIKSSFSEFWKHFGENSKKLFTVSFVSTQKNEQNRAVLHWNNQSIPFSYENPNASKLPLPLWALIAFGLIVLAGVAYFVLIKRKQVIVEPENKPVVPSVDTPEPTISMKPAPVSEPKKDLKRTIIAQGSAGVPTLFISHGNENKTLELGMHDVSIGRSTSNTLVIAETTLSGQHAIIRWQHGRFVVEDLGSTNGTTVNGAKIKSQVLKDGDVIRMGAVRITFRG